VLDPLWIIQIPVDALHNADLKRSFRIPAQISLNLARIDTITTVMTKAIFYVLDEPLVNLRIIQPLPD
jgi:hypothetical protein